MIAKASLVTIIAIVIANALDKCHYRIVVPLYRNLSVTQRNSSLFSSIASSGKSLRVKDFLAISMTDVNHSNGYETANKLHKLNTHFSVVSPRIKLQ